MRERDRNRASQEFGVSRCIGFIFVVGVKSGIRMAWRRVSRLSSIPRELGSIYWNRRLYERNPPKRSWRGRAGGDPIKNIPKCKIYFDNLPTLTQKFVSYVRSIALLSRLLSFIPLYISFASAHLKGVDYKGLKSH